MSISRENEEKALLEIGFGDFVSKTPNKTMTQPTQPKASTVELNRDYQNAVQFANEALDVPYADPDDELRTVSRQFLRLIERCATLSEQIREDERQRIISAMTLKNLDDEEYKVLIDGLDKVTKNIQLLSGGVTERQAIVLPNDITDKYGE